MTADNVVVTASNESEFYHFLTLPSGALKFNPDIRVKLGDPGESDVAAIAEIVSYRHYRSLSFTACRHIDHALMPSTRSYQFLGLPIPNGRVNWPELLPSCGPPRMVKFLGRRPPTCGLSVL